MNSKNTVLITLMIIVCLPNWGGANIIPKF